MKKNMMVDFKNRKMVERGRYKEIILSLSLDKELDLKWSDFMKVLDFQVATIINKNKLNEYEGNILFKVFTDLNRQELESMRDVLFKSVIDALIVERTHKNKEEILGLETTKELLDLDILITSLMDLLNYPLQKEVFDIEFYDSKKYLFRPMVRRKG